MKSKNRTVTFDLNNQIKLILNKHLVKFETKDEKWEVAFGEGSMEYAQIVYLISKKDLAAMQNLSVFLIFTRLIVSDVDFCNKYSELLTEFLKDKEVEKPVDKKEDDKTLAEEKVLHEKTPEAIQELENMKKDE